MNELVRGHRSHDRAGSVLVTALCLDSEDLTSVSLICFSPLRLCTMRNCSDDPQFRDKQEGFLEYLNSTTLQWVPYCDSRFSEHNAQVVCRQMGMEPLNAWVSHGTRVEFHPNSLTRIWSWPEPVQCTGQCFHHYVYQ